jgi:putative ABC transport system permease protein
VNPLRSHLRRRDLVELSARGIRSHPLRAVLSALGIAIGIAAMIAVIGISTSSQALVRERLAGLGTNLLTISPNADLGGDPVRIDPGAMERIRRIAGVTTVSGAGVLTEQSVYRSRLIDPGRSGGLVVTASDQRLLTVTGARLATGSWFNPATARLPVTVLGASAAHQLGITTPGAQIWLGGRTATVVGILSPVPLAPELDRAALVGARFARSELGFTGSPTVIYERSSAARVTAVRELLPETVRPQAPAQIAVSRPSDALAAAAAFDSAFATLLVAVGSIALLVGGIGVANTMVIAVLERRQEIGMRRALGATRGHIRSQFLLEAVLLSALGGAAGVAVGCGITAIVVRSEQGVLAIPAAVVAAGIGATLLVGAIAGAVPAVRAARTPPAAALTA